VSVFQPSDFGPPFGANFIPNLQYVTNITNSQQAVVTFANTTNFTLWEWVSFRIPNDYGMIQLNNQKAKIIALTANTATIDIDTLQFYPFTMPMNPQQPCIAVPVASGINPVDATVILEDAFDNEPSI